MIEYLKNRVTKEWAIKAGIRAIKTVAQTAIGVIGSAYLITEVNWSVVVSASLMAGLSSMLMSLKGLPEVSEE